MKLGIYPKLVHDTCKRIKLKRHEFELLLWAVEQEWFSTEDVITHVAIGYVSAFNSIKRLVDVGLLRVVRKGYYAGFPRRYAITTSSRMIIQNFYTKLKYSQPQ